MWGCGFSEIITTRVEIKQKREQLGRTVAKGKYRGGGLWENSMNKVWIKGVSQQGRLR